MAEIGFCPRGGQEGLRVTTHELYLLADVLGENYIDTVMPVPNRQPRAHGEHGDSLYWEIVEGKHEGHHGWCCKKCGEVVQWG